MWVMNADGTNRRELGAASTTGRARRSGSPDGRAVLFTVQERGNVAAVSRCRSAARRRAAPEIASSTSAAAVGVVLDGEERARLHAVDADRSGGAVRRAARKLTDLNAGGARRQAARRGRIVHVRLERQQVRGRGVPDQAARPRPTTRKVSADREHPRRPARPAGAGVQLQESGLRRARLGDADGELPRLDRLRPGVRRRGLRRSERQRRAGRALRRERRDAALSVDRSRSARRRGHELRRPAERLADHADQHLQGGDSHRGDHQPHQLQLHDLLQPVRSDGVRRRFRTRAT